MGTQGETPDDLTSIHVRRATEGDAQSLEWLVARFDAFIEAHVRFRLGVSATGAGLIRDLVNEAWLVTLPKISSLRPRDGRWAPVLVKYLGTTVTFLCNNQLRRSIREQKRAPQKPAETGSPADAMDRLPADSVGVITRVVRDDALQHVRDCLQRLSERSREVLILRLMEQRGNQEIAATLGIPPNTVAARYRRALADLRQCLPGSLFDEIWGADVD